MESKTFFHLKSLGEVLSFRNGESIKTDDTGMFPVYGANGIIGGCSNPKDQNAIIIGRVGAYCGAVSYCPGKFCSTDNTIVAYPISNLYNILFLFYFLKDMNLNKWAGGAAQPLLTQTVLKRIETRLPPLPTQRKIAAILSAYDDLIENNTRRIKILENMAQSLYQEWFVKFRFPGHEQVTFVDSPLGKIPEGWEIKTTKAVTSNYDRLRKPLSSMQRLERQGSHPYYGAAKIVDYIDSYIFDGVYLLLAEDGSVVTNDRKPVLQYVCGKFWANNHTHILQGKGLVSTEFLYLAFSNIDIIAYITGAAQPKITQANLNRIAFIVPDDNTLIEFNNIIQCIFKETIALGKKNSILRKTRDLLLPKLISGELDVSNLDISIPEEMSA